MGSRFCFYIILHNKTLRAAVQKRTKAGLERARAQGKTPWAAAATNRDREKINRRAPEKPQS
jgi:hypothetical protein